MTVNTLVGLVEVRLLSWTLASFGFWIVHEALRAAVALASGSIPVVGFRARLARSVRTLVRLIFWAGDVKFLTSF